MHIRGMIRKLSCFLCAFFPLLIFLLTSPAFSQGGEITWERLDVEITILPDGDFWVRETHIIRVVSGSFDYLLFKIPANHLDSIRDVRVWEDGQPCASDYEGERCRFSVEYKQEHAAQEYDRQRNEWRTVWYRDWYYISLDLSRPIPRSGPRHTYEVRYRVCGGLRYYDEGDQLWWKAIREDYRHSPVLASRVTVHLPEGAVAEKAEAYFADATVSGIGTNTVVFEVQQVLEQYDEMEIRVRFPHGVVAGSAPTWQKLQEAEPGINLVMGALGGLIGAGGVLLVILLRRRRRRLMKQLPLEYLTKPPSDMPPGMAAALVHELWGEWNLKATLVDLARRGYLWIEEKLTPDGVRVDCILHRTNKPDDDLLPYERMMLSKLTGQKGERSLTDFRQMDYRFYVGKLRARVYDQLVKDGYFRTSPGKVAGICGCLALALLVVSIVGAPAAYFILEAVVKEPIIGVIWPFVGTGVASIALMTGGYIWVKTPRGAEEAARWLAFGRYLQTGSTGGDPDQFEEYLPYALAFRIFPTDWAERFSHLTEIPLPEWFTVSWCDRKGRPLPIREEWTPPENFWNAETFARHLEAVLEIASGAFRRPEIRSTDIWGWE